MANGKMHAHQKSFEWFYRPTIPVGEGVSVQEAVNDYLQTVHVKYLRPRTQEEYLKELQPFAEWCAQHTVVQDSTTKRWSASVGGQIMLHQVNDQVVYLFVQHLKMTLNPAKYTHTDISTYTLASYVRVIKTFLNWCFLDEHYTQHVDFVTIQRIKKPPVADIIPEIFSREQIEALFAACDKEGTEYLQVRDRAILAVFLDTGIRTTELATLRRGHVYLDPEDAHIKVLGKGGKWGEVGLGKKAQDYLQQYISTFRDPAIEREIAHILDKRRKQIIRQQSFLFMNRRGKPMTKSGLWRMFQRLGDWAQVELDKCSPHVFRFTFAVNFIGQGGDIYRLSRLLRHSSFDVTEWYLRSLPQREARKGAKSVLDNLY
jgi:integrase/recombinase XerD